MADIERQSFEWRMSFNPAPATWRERLAARLRAWATRLDGYTVMTVCVHSKPELSVDDLAVVLQRGMDTMRRGLRDEVRQEALELMLKRTYPELFERG